MGRGRSRLVAGAPAGLGEPEEQVGLLGVEEEALVEATDRIQGVAAEQDTAAGDPLRRAGPLVGLEVAYGVTRPGGGRRDAMQEQRLRVGRAQLREAPLRERELARLVARARADGGQRRVGAKRGC